MDRRGLPRRRREELQGLGGAGRRPEHVDDALCPRGAALVPGRRGRGRLAAAGAVAPPPVQRGHEEPGGRGPHVPGPWVPRQQRRRSRGATAGAAEDARAAELHGGRSIRRQMASGAKPENFPRNERGRGAQLRNPESISRPCLVISPPHSRRRWWLKDMRCWFLVGITWRYFSAVSQPVNPLGRIRGLSVMSSGKYLFFWMSYSTTTIRWLDWAKPSKKIRKKLI